MYGANKKSIDDFKNMLASISKKLEYINYQWAKDFINYMDKNRDSLYNQYEQIIIENCKRDGRQAKIFLSKQLHDIFKESMNKRYKIETKTLTV